MDFDPEIVKENYIRLLEQSNTELHRKARVFTKRNILVFSGIFGLLGLLLYLVLFSAPKPSAPDLKDYLTAVPYSTGKLLIEQKGEFYEIAQPVKCMLGNNLLMDFDRQQLQISFINGKSVPLKFKIFTPEQQTYRLILPDDSEILINRQSSLEFCTARSGCMPQIQLDGEAYFNIKHDETSPFQIRAGEMQIEVLGTEFNVNNYKSTDFPYVALINGSVKVAAKQQSKRIKPGQKAVLYSENLSVLPADLANLTAWTKDNWVFDRQKLTDIVQKIENWYHVEFIIPDEEIRNLKFSGNINKQDGLLQFLQILEYTEGIKYSIDKNYITLTK